MRDSGTEVRRAVGLAVLLGLAFALVAVGPTGAATRHARTTITIAGASDETISGAVDSKRDECLRQRKVALEVASTGEVLSSGVTKGSGAWSIDATTTEPVNARVGKRKVGKGRHALVCKAAVAGPRDVTPPALEITSPAPGSTTGPEGTVIYTVGDAVTVSCMLDDGPAGCDATGLYNYSLGDGSHTLTLQGADALGNTATRPLTWTVDANPPVVTAVSSPAGASGTITFSLSDTSAIAEIHCVLDGTETVCGSGTSGMLGYSDLEPGVHHFDVYGVDELGNSGEAAAPTSTPPGVRVQRQWTVSG